MTSANPSRPLLLFVGKALLLFYVFLALWNYGPNHLYRSFIAQCSTTAFKSLHDMGNPWMVMVQPKITGKFDATVAVMNSVTRQLGTQPINLKYQAYDPTILMLSLVLASPISWKRKALAAIGGLILVHLWIAFSLTLIVWNAYATPGPLAIYDLAPWALKVLTAVTETVSVSTATRYAIPVIIWVLVTFRRDDWLRFTGEVESPRLQKEAGKTRHAARHKP